VLILKRGEGETLVIGENVTITVLDVTGDHFRVGIVAPSDVTVHREEIHQNTVRQGDQ